MLTASFTIFPLYSYTFSHEKNSLHRSPERGRESRIGSFLGSWIYTFTSSFPSPHFPPSHPSFPLPRPFHSHTSEYAHQKSSYYFYGKALRSNYYSSLIRSLGHEWAVKIVELSVRELGILAEYEVVMIILSKTRFEMKFWQASSSHSPTNSNPNRDSAMVVTSVVASDDHLDLPIRYWVHSVRYLLSEYGFVFGFVFVLLKRRKCGLMVCHTAGNKYLNPLILFLLLSILLRRLCEGELDLWRMWRRGGGAFPHPSHLLFPVCSTYSFHSSMVDPGQQ